jgi:hypothetical protein
MGSRSSLGRARSMRSETMMNDLYCNGHDNLGSFVVRTVKEIDGCACAGGKDTIVLCMETCGWCGKEFPVLEDLDLFVFMEAEIQRMTSAE